MKLSPFWEALDSELPGQSKAIQALAAVIEHRALAHAYLLAGPAGAGKLRAAVALAAAENCDDHGCETCALCRSVHALARQEAVNPDILILRPQGRDYPIEQIRELRRSVASRPVELQTKFVIILSADRMKPVSANALLKTLEEPPDHTCIVLVTDRWDALLPTVRSRCQLVQFKSVGEEQLARRLMEETGADRAAALAACRAAGDRLGAAEALLNAPAFESARKLVETIVEDLEHRDAYELLGDAESMVDMIEDLGAALSGGPKEISYEESEIDDMAVSRAHAGRLRSARKDWERRTGLVRRAEGASVVLGLFALAYRDLLCAATGAADIVHDPAAVERRGAILRHAGARGATGALDAVARARTRIRSNVIPKNALAAMLFEISEATTWRRRSA